MERPNINTSNESDESAQSPEDIAAERRIKSDASLLAEGAKIKAGRLEATEKQLETLRAQMNQDIESRTPENQARKKAGEAIRKLNSILGPLYGGYARLYAGPGSKSDEDLKKEALEILADCGIPITEEETLDAQGASFFEDLQKESLDGYREEDRKNVKTPLHDFIVAHYLEKSGT